MSKIFEKVLNNVDKAKEGAKHRLSEGFIFDSKVTIWTDEVNGLIKALLSMKKAGSKYKDYVKKKNPNEVGNVALQIQMIGRSAVKGIIKDKGMEMVTLILMDSNSVCPEKLGNIPANIMRGTNAGYVISYVQVRTQISYGR